MATKSDTKKKTTTKKSTTVKKSTTAKKATTTKATTKKVPVKKVVKKTVKKEEPVVVTKNAWYKHPLIVGLAAIIICFFLGYAFGCLINMVMK